MEKKMTIITKKQEFAEQDIDAFLNFYGVVKDNRNLNIENAIVMLFACFKGGIEKPAAYTFTDKEGKYFILLPKPPDNHDILKFRVRASKPQIFGKAFDYPVTGKKKPYTEPIRDNTNSKVPDKDEISNKINFYVPAQNHEDGLINSGKVGESEYYQKLYQQLNRQTPERVFFVQPGQSLVFDNLPVEPGVEPVEKIEHLSIKGEFNSAAFLYSYLACLVFWLQIKKLNYFFRNTDIANEKY